MYLSILKHTFDDLEKWFQMIGDSGSASTGGPEIILIGNKSDLSMVREVEYDDAKVFY